MSGTVRKPESRGHTLNLYTRVALHPCPLTSDGQSGIVTSGFGATVPGFNAIALLTTESGASYSASHRVPLSLSQSKHSVDVGLSGPGLVDPCFIPTAAVLT